ncbi:RCC1 domain-containing protein [Nocardioides yefusunii]|uniref:RCC1 domain-containing protein n=1 Tax=Nocardioides yefusunii TaxID=2500546 RepID=A0ABW1QUY3_9ACTN|nr:hypothetical protein [Nocardioides yefusunii]
MGVRLGTQHRRTGRRGEPSGPRGRPLAISHGAIPTTVALVAVAAGANHTLALDSDGFVYAWGTNSWGEVGNGATGDPVLEPTRVLAGALPGGVRIIDVAAGSHHSVALGSDGRLYAWGRNDLGQLGEGTTDSRAIPVSVNLGAMLPSSRVVTLAAGAFNTYAITDDRLTYAWGVGSDGQLGNGNASPWATSPARVTVVP